MAVSYAITHADEPTANAATAVPNSLKKDFTT